MTVDFIVNGIFALSFEILYVGHSCPTVYAMVLSSAKTTHWRLSRSQSSRLAPSRRVLAAGPLRRKLRADLQCNFINAV